MANVILKAHLQTSAANPETTFSLFIICLCFHCVHHFTTFRSPATTPGLPSRSFLSCISTVINCYLIVYALLKVYTVHITPGTTPEYFVTVCIVGSSFAWGSIFISLPNFRTHPLAKHQEKPWAKMFLKSINKTSRSWQSRNDTNSRCSFQHMQNIPYRFSNASHLTFKCCLFTEFPSSFWIWKRDSKEMYIHTKLKVFMFLFRP